MCQAIFQKKREAVFAEPLRDGVAFMIHPQFHMTAARRDHYSSAGCGFLRRQIHGDRRLVHTGNNVLAIRSEPNFFRRGLAFGTGRAIRPQQHDDVLIRGNSPTAQIRTAVSRK